MHVYINTFDATFEGDYYNNNSKSTKRKNENIYKYTKTRVEKNHIRSTLRLKERKTDIRQEII